MSTQVQYRRGSATENNAFTGALAEITVDTTNWTLRVHDGATAGGGGNVATVAYVTAQLAALSANAITFGTSNVQIPSSGSNIRINVGGTSNVAVFATTGANITGTLGVSGNITGGNLSGTNIVGTLTTAAQTNITSVGTLSTLTVSGALGAGAITGSSLTVSTGNITGGNIVNAGANGVGNIGTVGGYFNTVFAKATSAQYADLAEMYQGDDSYFPGTVVEFGGTHEVTITTESTSTRIAGVVSTNPSYLMNSGLNGVNSVPVALTGRVPCQVVGPVKKGDILVSSAYPGVAQALNETDYRPGCIIGKSLEDWSDPSVKIIEVVVGRV